MAKAHALFKKGRGLGDVDDERRGYHGGGKDDVGDE